MSAAVVTKVNFFKQPKGMFAMPSLQQPPNAITGYEALKQTTDKLVVEHEQAERKALTYRQKLSEAEAYVKRLEDAYNDLLCRNGKLRTLAENDHNTVSTLSSKVLRDQELINNLQQSVLLLESQIEKVGTDRSIVLEELKSSRDTAKAITGKLQAAVSEVNTLRLNLTQALEERAQLEATHTAIVEKLTATNNHLSTEKASALEQLTALTSRLALAETHHAAETERANQLTTTLQSTETSLNEQLAAVKAELAAVDLTIGELTSDVMGLQDEICGLESALEEEKRAKRDLEKIVEKLEGKLGVLEEEHKKLVETHNATLKELETKRQDLVAAEGKLVELQAIYDQALQKHEEELAKLQESGSSASKQFVRLQDQYKNDLAAVEAKLKEAENNAKQARQDAAAATEAGERQLAAWRERATKEIGEIKTKYEGELESLKKTHEEALKLASEKDAKHDQEIAKLECRLDNLNQSFNTCQTKLATTTSDLTAANRALQAKDAELSKTRSAMEDLEHKMEEILEELEAKRQLLHGISAVAAQGENAGSQGASGGKKKGRKTAGGTGGRATKRVHFQSPVDNQHNHSEPDWGYDDGGDDGQIDDPHTAMVVHGSEPATAAAATKGGVSSYKNKSVREHKQQPIIEEIVSDEDEDSQGEEDHVYIRKAVPRGVTKPSSKGASFSTRRMGAMIDTFNGSQEQKKEKSRKKDSKKKSGKSKTKKSGNGGGQFQAVVSLFGGLAGAYSPESSSLS